MISRVLFSAGFEIRRLLKMPTNGANTSAAIATINPLPNNSKDGTPDPMAEKKAIVRMNMSNTPSPSKKNIALLAAGCRN